MKEKSVTFTKGKSKFLQNQRGQGDFSVENLGLFFQSSGNAKQEIITRNWPHKLSHKLPNNLRLMVVGNEELVDSNFNSCFWISARAFEFQLVLLSFQLVTRNSQLVTRDSCFTISRFYLLWTRICHNTIRFHFDTFLYMF